MKYPISPYLGNSIVDNFFKDEFFNSFFNKERTGDYSVEETDSSYIYKIDMPGVKKEDVTVDLYSGMITVAGERKSQSLGNPLKENRVKYFRKTFSLPEKAFEDDVSAEYENGVLTLTVNKAKESGRRKIPIK